MDKKDDKINLNIRIIEIIYQEFQNSQISSIFKAIKSAFDLNDFEKFGFSISMLIPLFK